MFIRGNNMRGEGDMVIMGMEVYENAYASMERFFYFCGVFCE